MGGSSFIVNGTGSVEVVDIGLDMDGNAVFLVDEHSDAQLTVASTAGNSVLKVSGKDQNGCALIL